MDFQLQPHQRRFQQMLDSAPPGTKLRVRRFPERLWMVLRSVARRREQSKQ